MDAYVVISLSRALHPPFSLFSVMFHPPARSSLDTYCFCSFGIARRRLCSLSDRIAAVRMMMRIISGICVARDIIS